MLDRQEIIATNKSLRIIKNELEGLLEKGVIDDGKYDEIMGILPGEQSLRGASGASPAPRSNPTSPPVNSMANLALSQPPSASPAPPAYNQTGPLPLPARNNPPPPPPPSKPIIAHAKALYKYQAADDRDLSFERDDKIAVHEYMNNDWWMGKNLRTNAEGIFPKNYVEIDHSPPPPVGGYANEKATGYYAPPHQPTYTPMNQGYPAPPTQANPYNSSAPPMAVANDSNSQQGGDSGKSGKAGEMGKKFGKKMGNAAIFGAGATMGSNLVNSIF